MGKPFREVMAAQGLYISRRRGLSRGPVVPLTKDTGIVLGRNGHPNRPCSNCLAVIDASGRQWRNDTSLPHLRSDQVTDSGGEEPRYVRVFFVDMFVAIAPYRFKMISHVMSCTLSVFFYVLGILFAVRLCRQGRRSTSHEQIWVLILIFITSFYFNVYESVIRILEETDPNRNEDKFDKWVYRLEEVLTGSRDLAFTVFTFFYLWASLHSYRILDPTKPLAFKTFYLPKLLVLVPYVIFRLVCLFVLSMHLSEVPVMSAPALLFTFGEFNMWRYLKAELLYCIASSVIELMIVGLIVYEALKSLRILRKAPYMKHRTKRVGFRFFIYLNFLFYPSFIFLQALTMFARDKGENILLIIPGVNMPMADPIWYYTMGPAVLVVGYVVVTAHVHLPATSVGAIKGWFKSSALAESGSRWSFGSTTSRSTHANYCVDSTPTPFSGSSTWVHDENTPRSVVDNDNEMDHQIVEPFTYRMKESPHSLELKANCFTMQTHVILFNFAWYVYYYGTPKLNNWKTKENPLPFEYKIAAHIKCDSTDTQVLVLDCFDRIIVAFKGSTSKRNMRTSLQMNYENVHSVIRTNIRGEDETGRLKRMFGRSYTNGKVHRGFAIAYRSVAGEVMEKVRALRGEKRRPVFLTGHSLGGALATICSMDVWVKLELSRREIFVSTFGSPRVGNADFADIYDKVVPLHWRIVVDPDMVAKLPKGGYKHVGKKAVLTPHGDMIIDPNYLDRRPWSGETAGFAYHRKASYLLAMRAWCVRNHGMVYTPVFWPFPLRKEDHKRFESAFTDEGEIVKGHSNRIASKIIHMDAMVDALGHGDQALANMAVVEKWARLTRRILLNARLTENTSFEFQ
ncbi:Lipase domain protein, putative [Chondrus crispus]|uniref:Lipase domain protein, putative n=1 Tax=Chondrus crispus TaxID=2769 RepID=R7QIT5_CHOCR|nr:Lipase domain protein, putative [Chondrus crispus]CDF37386.1 Lipase domain protein, putative [Chondrus crispus]|eukprot:XP_005717205.1 Lipase domain protein, putative [Chondrus crispus]